MLTFAQSEKGPDVSANFGLTHDDLGKAVSPPSSGSFYVAA
jgi:hypothetical protein